jgi:hypothetical protein
LERRFAGDGGRENPEELTRDRLAEFGGEQLLGYFDARIDTVASLTAEVSATAGESTSVAFLDLSGAEKGFATGQPAGEAVAKTGWQTGVDVNLLAQVCDTIETTGYAADPNRLSFDLDAYHTLLAGASRLGLVLRPMTPDCRSAANLAAKVSLARERRLHRLDFYHYGFCRLRSLDWIRQSLTAN